MSESVRTETPVVDWSQFCGSKWQSARYDLNETFVQEGFKYATDGRIILRQLASDPDTTEGKFPIGKNVFTDFPEDFSDGEDPVKYDTSCEKCGSTGQMTFDECQTCRGTGQCDECDGTGYTDCQCCGNEADCDECDGTGDCPECNGKVKLDQPWQEECSNCYYDGLNVGFSLVSLLNLRKIQSLPGARVKPFNRNMVHFIADGGLQGVVMCLRSNDPLDVSH
jgi:hypothetical protein